MCTTLLLKLQHSAMHMYCISLVGYGFVLKVIIFVFFVHGRVPGYQTISWLHCISKLCGSDRSVWTFVNSWRRSGKMRKFCKVQALQPEVCLLCILYNVKPGWPPWVETQRVKQQLQKLKPRKTCRAVWNLFLCLRRPWVWWLLRNQRVYRLLWEIGTLWISIPCPQL